MRQIISQLSANYRSNIRDYEELAADIIAFKQIVDAEAEKAPEDKRNELDQFEQQLQAFVEKRNRLFASLKEKAEEAKCLQMEVASLVRTGSFTLDSLIPHITKTEYEEIQTLADMLNSRIKEVLILDQEIITKIKTEVEYVKLELHRIQSAKITRNAYNNAQSDARFIDKTK